MVLSSGLALLLTMVSLNAGATTDPQPRREMLEAVRAFEDAMWDSPGFDLEDEAVFGSGTVDLRTVDLRSGYSSDGQRLTDWAGGEYTAIGDAFVDPRALDLMGARGAQWVWVPPASNTWSNPILSTTPLTWFTIDGSAPSQTTSVTRTQDGERAWTMHTSDGPVSVRITATQLEIRSPQARVTWTMGEHVIATPSPEMVVASSDADEAEWGLRQVDAVPGIVTALRRATKRSSSPVRALRRTARRAARELHLTAQDIPRGLELGARSRYVDRAWRIQWDTGRNAVVVSSTDHHPVGWAPPRAPVNVLPPSPPTDIGKQALRTLSAAIVAALRMPGVLIDFGGPRNEFSAAGGAGALDYTNGFAGIFAPDGSVAAVAGRGRECYLIHTPNSPKTKRALVRAGKSHATWSCTWGGDTELGWLPAFGPTDFLVPVSRLLYGPDLQLTDTEPFRRFQMGVGTGEVALRFEGELLTNLTLGTFGEQGDAGLRVGYSYGPVHLRLPPASRRVNGSALEEARLSLRAPTAARRAALITQRCARKRIAAGARPLPAIRLCALDVVQRKSPSVLAANTSEGARLQIETRYSLDSRDVLWTGSRVLITNIVHRVKR